MKSAFAILFSLLLIVTQTAFMARRVDSVSRKDAAQDCACSNCHKHCCITNAVPGSQPVPAASTRTFSQTDWQLLVAVTHALLNQPVAFSPPEISTSSPSLPPAVLLYQRNCSYLI